MNRLTAEAMAGSWTEDRPSAGISMKLSLAARDTTLVGTVTYSTPSGVEATASITGYVFWQDAESVPSGHTMPAQSVVVLDFAFANGETVHFDQGTLQARDTLFGVLNFSDAPGRFESYGTLFVRAQ